MALLALALAVPAAAAQQAGDLAEGTWYTVEDGEIRVMLYYVWSPTCPHCLEAKPFIAALPEERPWIDLRSMSVEDEANVDLAVALSQEIGEDIRGVPAFMWCGRLEMGYGSDETTGADLVDSLEACKADLEATLGLVEDPTTTTTTVAEDTVDVPVLGEVDAATVSLPLFAITLGALDAFNPCAFFVLLFLLSVLVHARSRARMAVVGGVFVLVSGVVYFAFMAAWLNVFTWLDDIAFITVIAGIIAVTIGLLNTKDFFWFKRGVSLSIPDGARPGLFRRMRTLTAASSLPAMLVGALTLAVAANSYELLCTAGFPLVFTRVLTLNDLPTSTYYAYLALYNVVYVLPLFVIVGGFVWKLGSRKLSEEEGRVLKLLSGLMMLGLGSVLLFRPEWLTNLLTAIVLLAGAVVLTVIITILKRYARRHGTGAAAT